VFILDTLFIGGIKFVLRRVAEAVDAEMNNVETLRQELLAAQMRLELGEITEAEFSKLEAAVLARLREIREAQEAEAGAGGPVQITGIDVSFAGDTEGESPDTTR
jgi:gas vesicle protein GvpG